MVDLVMYRGYGLASDLHALRAHVNDDEHRRVLEGLPKEFRAAIPRLDPGAWYPLAWLDAMYDQVLAVKGLQGAEERDAFLYAMNQTAARQDIGTALKLLIRFLNPATLMKRLPMFWSKYFLGGPMPTVEIPPDPRHAIVRLHGFMGSRYIGVAIRSFAITIFEAMGSTGKVHETVDGDDLRWDVYWK